MPDPVALTALLKDYGPWGLLALSLTALTWAVMGWHGCSDKRIADRDAVRDVVVKLATDATAAQLESARAISDRTQVLQGLSASNIELARVVASMTATNEIQVDRVFDKLNEMLRAIERERRS